MTNENHRQLIIVGSGPAGFTAAIYAARANLAPMLISGMKLYGQPSKTATIENYPGFPNGVEGPELGRLFEEQARAFGAEVVYDAVEKIDLSQKPYQAHTYGGVFTADALILAMGTEYNKLGVPGEKELEGRGISNCATCDGYFTKGKNVHVVGGGDAAIEEAIFLTRFADSVTVIHRRDALRASAILEERARTNPKIKFIWNSVVEEIKGENAVEALVLKNVKTDELSTVPSQGLFVYIGQKPTTEIVGQQLATDDKGYIIIDENMETSVPQVYAAGDVADPHYRQIVTAAGMGAAAAISATRFLETLMVNSAK
ncbi:MAG TPA: thioredoxin-disulfide reductase [Anaerolineaceae bacterium]|nr:thioredoxin-disulfide reductase [Anaerolineaceae bacterium]